MEPFTAEAVVSRFFDAGNVSVHLWNATDRYDHYMMLQETQLETPRATGRLEVVSSLRVFFRIQNLGVCVTESAHGGRQTILGRLRRVDLITWVRCTSVRSYVRPYVRPSTKSFSDSDEIWYVG